MLNVRAVLAFRPAQKFSRVLTSLNLRSNRLDAEAGKALADALSVNAVMKKCDVSGNWLGEAAKRALRDAVKDRQAFELLV